ncbi:MAG: hypothetical protein HC825_04845 [Oscillatoriales cyanobacterium RM1_1_9]|nr:hypothetical protein [Oscillatoriales cyanobacterium RM1_1_9]
MPESYYQKLVDRGDHPSELAAQQLLIDVPTDHPAPAAILQTFTQPLFPEPTFFYEVIERRGSVTGFGEQNFQTLYEAMEEQQLRRQDLGARLKTPINGSDASNFLYHLMKQSKSADPESVSFLGLIRVVTNPEGITNLLHELFRSSRRFVAHRSA